MLDVYEEEALLKYLNRLPGPPSLRELMPELLRREVEVAISKLGLLYDQTYAWDIFSDMMVRIRHTVLLIFPITVVMYVCFSWLTEKSATMHSPKC